MKGWWAIGLVILTMSCTWMQNDGEITPQPSPTATAPGQPTVVSVQTPTLAPSVNVPLVSSERLFTHIQAFVGERYTQAERDRARNYLINTLKDYGWIVTTQSFSTGMNVIARQSKTPSSAETVLVVAHFDTVEQSPGADDNATGVVAALEVARLLHDRSSNKNLAIAFFDQEEQGLLGSSAFTANPNNLKNLLGVINLEMLGYTCKTPGCQTYPKGLPVTPSSDRGDFLGIVGDQEHPYLLQAFQLAQNGQTPPIITVPIPFKGILTPDVLRSDHASFWLRNIGAVMIGDTANFRNPHYHQPSDTLDTLDRSFLTQATQLVVNATAVLLDSQ